MKSILFIIIILSFYSCKTLNINGTYEAKLEDVGRVLLDLNSDSTFRFTEQIGISIVETKGRWDIHDKHLYLKSWDVYHDYNVQEKDSAGLNEIYFVIKEIYSMGTNGSYITLNTDTANRYFVNPEGIIVISKELSKFRSFDIHSGNGFDRHVRKDSKANFFLITFSMNNDLYYVDDVFPIKRRKVYYPYYSMFFKKK